jgi:predicted nuclease with TOPRIM domain
MNRARRETIAKNNQTFRQRMSTLGAENTQLKLDLEAAHKESAAISEERDALKAGPASEQSTEELERLRQEKSALEQALQEEKSKQPAQIAAPDTSELEARIVR